MLRTYLPDVSGTRLGERAVATIAAGLLGLVFLYGAGFASPQAVHDAAHDTRHAFTFPCH